LRISEWGIERQKKLKASKVIIAGVGGLGCSASVYLAAAGVGHLILIDKDKVDLSNLNRQILHWERDIGKNKVASAVNKLQALNSDIKIEGKVLTINERNAKDLIRGATVVVDGQDNFKTRFILNEACVEVGIPFVHGCIYGLEGRVMTVMPKKSACLRCVYKTTPPEQKSFPVLGATAAVTASLQAIETIKLITGIGKPLLNSLLIGDGSEMIFQSFEISKDPNCPVCGKKRR
jgi:adenylyltransferase/sulfurtransferase